MTTSISAASQVTRSTASIAMFKGDDYTSTRAMRVTITSDTDWTTKTLVIEATKDETTIELTATISGTGAEDQYADLNPDAATTGDWETGDYAMKVKIRDTGKDQTVETGTFTVRP